MAMQYFITEPGNIKVGPMSARAALNHVMYCDIPESDLRIVSEHGEKVDSKLLSARAYREEKDAEKKS